MLNNKLPSKLENIAYTGLVVSAGALAGTVSQISENPLRAGAIAGLTLYGVSVLYESVTHLLPKYKRPNALDLHNLATVSAGTSSVVAVLEHLTFR